MNVRKCRGKGLFLKYATLDRAVAARYLDPSSGKK